MAECRSEALFVEVVRDLGEAMRDTWVIAGTALSGTKELSTQLLFACDPTVQKCRHRRLKPAQMTGRTSC